MILNKRPQHWKNRPPKEVKHTFQSMLAVTKDILDVFLKAAAVLAFFPALAIFVYLRAIHRTDLFISSVLSGAGLIALLETTVIFVVALLIGTFGSSWFIGMIAGTYKDSRPTTGAIVLSATTIALLLTDFIYTNYLWDPHWTLLTRQVAIASPLLGMAGILAVIAHINPKWFNVLSPEETADKRGQLGKIGLRLLLSGAGGLFTTPAVVTLYSLAKPYHLPQAGWENSLAVVWIIIASTFPGFFYLHARQKGLPGVGTSLLVLAGTLLAILPLPLFQTSVEPIFLITMKVMGIVETAPRTFELVNTSEQPDYQVLKFPFRGNTKLFDATIRYQFGDTKLLCKDLYDPVSEWPGAVPFGAPPAPDASAPPSTCITANKDDIRVVQLPPGFTVPDNPVTTPPQSSVAQPKKAHTFHVARPRPVCPTSSN